MGDSDEFAFQASYVPSIGLKKEEGKKEKKKKRERKRK